MDYVTKLGDTWDSIAKETLGSETEADRLMRTNEGYCETVVFKSGVVLTVPQISKINYTTAPDWRI